MINHYFSAKKKTMATPVKHIPVLEGASAEEFIRRADENERHPTPRLSPEEKERLRRVLAKSRSFRFR